MSLGYSFEPRPNSHSLATAISGMTIGFIKKQMLALKKTSLTRGYKIKWSRILGWSNLKGLT